MPTKRKPSAKKPTASARAAKKATARRRPAKKVPAKKPTAKKPTKKPTRKKLPAKKPTAKKPPAKKPPAKKPPVRKKTPANRPASRRLTHLDALETRARAATEKNRLEAEKLIAGIRKRLARIEADFHAIGRALRRLNQESLYRSLGYRSFAALLVAEKLVTKTQAYKLIAVADAYPAAQARNLGIGKAYQLLAYAAATPAADIARTLATENPRIGNRRLDRMTVRDLREATRRVKATTGAKKADTQPERDARRLAREVQRALRAKGAKSAKAYAHRLDGHWSIRLDLGVDDADILL